MDKKDITVEFIEYEDSGLKESFDTLLKLHGKPFRGSQPIEFSSCELKDMLAELGITKLEDGSHIKELLNDILLASGLARVQTSDGKITIEQTCE